MNDIETDSYQIYANNIYVTSQKVSVQKMRSPETSDDESKSEPQIEYAEISQADATLKPEQRLRPKSLHCRIVELDLFNIEEAHTLFCKIQPLQPFIHKAVKLRKLYI